MKIYISGAITNNPNYLYDFGHAEGVLKEKFPNDEIINPISIEHKLLANWVDYMKDDIRVLLECDAVYMLKGWQRSKGATLEFVIAKHLDMTVIFEDKNEKWGR